MTSSTPANLGDQRPRQLDVVINFSESVTASPGAFSIQCPAGVPQSFAQSAAPATTFTLTPSSPLPYSTTCTVTVTADQISDTDANDPPDHDGVGRRASRSRRLPRRPREPATS